MGWGLRVAEDVSKGSLVGEYVGEVRSKERWVGLVGRRNV
ncbi:unnamed protein product [Laminaria digitata]